MSDSTVYATKEPVMGTNYYLHLGKRIGGPNGTTRFTWAVNLELPTSEEGIKVVADHIPKGATVQDEYGHEMTFGEFLELSDRDERDTSALGQRPAGHGVASALDAQTAQVGAAGRRAGDDPRAEVRDALHAADIALCQIVADIARRRGWDGGDYVATPEEQRWHYRIRRLYMLREEIEQDVR